VSRHHGSTGLVTPNNTFSQLIGTLTSLSTGGFKLRRVSWGFSSNNTTPASQQCVLVVSPFTVAPTGGTVVALDQMDPNSYPPQTIWTYNGGTAFTSAGTIRSTSLFTLPLNSQSGGDLPWEQLEEWSVPKGAANGLAFTLSAALPASPTTQVALNVEVEE
jgi:hypothetical protein